MSLKTDTVPISSAFGFCIPIVLLERFCHVLINLCFLQHRLFKLFNTGKGQGLDALPGKISRRVIRRIRAGIPFHLSNANNRFKFT